MALFRSSALRSFTGVVFEKAQKLTRAKRIVIFAATLLILGGAFAYFIHMPKSAKIHRFDQSVADLERQLKLAKIRAQRIDRLRAEFRETEEQLQQAMKLLPDKQEIPSLLKSITQVGIDSNLDFVLFMPGDEKPRDFYMEIPVAIEVKGEYREVALFFDKVRQMERIVNIENISMKPEKDLSTQLLTRCNALTYRFKVKADEQKEKKGKKERKRS
ncbi:MAG: type 4a pilus biogenesis protein PilO [Desulfobacteraceae bacterium]